MLFSLPEAARNVRDAMRFSVGALALLGGAAVQAAFPVIDEAGIDAIYSQEAFGESPIDIVFSAVQTLDRGDLRVIDSGLKLEMLFASAVSGWPALNVFFVDRLEVCGAASGSLGGCAETPGNLLVVDGEFTANPVFGANNLAHEIAHNLGLPHVLPNDGTNLLNPTISYSFALTPAQVSVLLNSPLVQVGPTGRYVTVTPIAVVPEPDALPLLFASAVAAVGVTVRRPRAGRAH